jgi:predicted nucleotide-binding protein
LTSNYDALIEGAYAVESEGVLPSVFSADGVNHALERLRNGKFFVFKVHGDLNIPGSIVLGNRDYSRLMYLSPAYRSFLETVFASYTVLFVGFGGNDPDLDAVVDRLSAIYERSIGQHFLLISDAEFSALERRRLLEDKRLDCITYESDSGHSQVGEFLKALSLRAAPGAEVPTPFEPSQERPRAFICGSYREVELLRRLAEMAQRVGFDTWFAETRVSAGERIADTISKAIDETDCMIVVMSDGAADSSWVQFEIGRARGAQKMIFPIRIGNAKVPSDLTGVLYLQIESSELSASDEAGLEAQLKRFIVSVRDS